MRMVLNGQNPVITHPLHITRDIWMGFDSQAKNTDNAQGNAQGLPLNGIHMKKIIDFFKTTVLGGLVVLIPFAILSYVLLQMFSVIQGINATLAGKLPYPILENPVVLIAVSIIALIVICFITGLLLKTLGGKPIQKFNEFLESKIPMYAMVRTLTKRLTGAKGTEFSPAEIDLYGTETRMMGFIVEKLPDDRICVFVPTAPAITVGQIFIVPKDQVSPLDATPAEAANVITQWGVGTKSLYPAISAKDAD
jgi:uncharacterized membrane protein